MSSSSDAASRTVSFWASAEAPAGAGARLCAPAAQRNAAPLLEALRALLPAPSSSSAPLRVLEVASGSGQHAAAFAEALAPRVGLWQATDVSPASLASIDAHRSGAAGALLPPAAALDVLAGAGPLPAAVAAHAPYDALLCVNLLHISPAGAVAGLAAAAAAALRAGGRALVYGPFFVDGQPTTPSNAAFDAQLRLLDAAYGLRDVADVAAAFSRCGLALIERRDMPANNFLLVFERG